MRRPIVERISTQSFNLSFILASILTQRFNASLAPIAIDPSPSEHATSKINTVQNVGLRYGNRFNTELPKIARGICHCLTPLLDVMREVMVAILPAVLDALVVQNLSVVIEADA